MRVELDSPQSPRKSVRFDDEEKLVTDSELLIVDSHRSTGSGGSGKSLGAGERLRGSLMREQKDRDPLYFYEVLNVVGVGSMGSVATVRKRDEVVGGSARKELVDSLRKHKKEKECFSLPLVGPMFQFCLKGSISDTSELSSKSSRDIFTSTSEASHASADTSSEDLSASRRSTMSRSNIVYAMKSIHLNRVKDETFIAELKNEIELLKALDHPHIVRPIETFFHRNQIFVVMELCSGGDLYSRDPYTEEEAARISSSILSAVSYMHSKNVTHRDLKYENILFVNDSPYAEVKLIDFGLSKKYIGGQKLTDGVGTIYTMAPEVLKGTYTAKADLWSIGVITYMLLSSQMPFYGRKRRHIVEQILKCQYDFKGRRWRRISQAAKEFVEELLVMDPDERPSAEEAAGCMWLNRRNAATVRNPTMAEVNSSNKSLKAYAGYSKLKKLSLMVIAHKSTTAEIGILRKVFKKYDTEKNGVLSFDEFKAAMTQAGHPEEHMEDLFEAVDLDGTGKIRYTEFLAATIEAQGAISEERLAEAFDRLDSDDSGYISAANLSEMLGDDFPKEDIDAIIRECDLTKDNKISYSEFLALWEDKSEQNRHDLYTELRPSFYSLESMQSQDGNTPHSSIREELSADSERDSNTMARANFIEEKKVSERKATVGAEEGKQVLFTLEADI